MDTDNTDFLRCMFYPCKAVFIRGQSPYRRPRSARTVCTPASRLVILGCAAQRAAWLRPQSGGKNSFPAGARDDNRRCFHEAALDIDDADGHGCHFAGVGRLGVVRPCPHALPALERFHVVNCH